MNDPYRLDDSASAESPPPAATSSPGGVSVLLWTLTAIAIGLNTALSIAGYTVIASVFGGVGALCIVALVVRYLRRRRS